jgi:hypothetical protein
MAFDDPFMLAPVRNPELNLIPGMAAPIPAGAQPPALVLASMADTSLSLGVAVQEPQVWSYDFDVTGAARASFPGFAIGNGGTTLGTPPNNTLTVQPGPTPSDPVAMKTSGTAGMQLTTPRLAVLGDVSATGNLIAGGGAANILTATPGANSTAPVTLSQSGTGGIQLNGRVGFGVAPLAKATVTGSRAANAALASLLTALAATGLLTDGTTA